MALIEAVADGRVIRGAGDDTGIHALSLRLSTAASSAFPAQPSTERVDSRL